jgi:hypothetical protein
MFYFLETLSRPKSILAQIGVLFNLRVPTKYVTDFPTFSVSRASGRSPSTRCATTENSGSQSLNVLVEPLLV